MKACRTHLIALLCLLIAGCNAVVVREEYLRTIETSMSNLPPLGPMAVGSPLKSGQIGLELGGINGLPANADGDGAKLDHQPANAIASGVAGFGFAVGSPYLEIGIRANIASGDSVTAYDDGALTVIPEIGLLSAVRLDLRSDLPITSDDAVGIGWGFGLMSAGFHQSTRTLRKGFGFDRFVELANCWPLCSDAEIAEGARLVQLYESEDPPQVDKLSRIVMTGVAQLGYRHLHEGFGGGFGAAVEVSPRAPALQVFRGICDGVCDGFEIPEGDDVRYGILVSPYAELNAELGGVPIAAWLFSSFPVESDMARLLVGGGFKVRWVFDTMASTADVASSSR